MIAMKNSKFLIAIFCLMILVMSDAASAATYIVAKDGSGNFNTLQQAANVAVAGDTVQVKAGTYNEQVIVKNSGTAGNPITFKNYGSDVVWVVQPKTMATYQGVFWIKNKNYITVEGFNIRGGYYGINLDLTDHVIVKNNYIENSLDSPIKVGWSKWSSNVIIDGNIANRDDPFDTLNYGETISISWAYNVIVKNNYIMHNNRGEGIDFKDGTHDGKIYNNLIEHTYAASIYVDGFVDGIYNVEIYNNLARNSIPGNGAGIFTASEKGGLVQNISIHNNEACGDGGNMVTGIGNSAFVDGPYVAKYRDIYFSNNNAHGATWVNYLFHPENVAGTFVNTGNTENPCSMADPRDNPAPCTPSWKCESPLNGYESDGCGNRRANAACNTVSVSSLALKPGWNQISSAVAAGIDLATIEQSCTILQYKNQKLWAWNAQAQSWINPAKIEPLKGYWVYVAYVCTVPISGTPAAFSSLPLSTGWNKISASGTLSAIAGTCANHITGNWIWNWDKATEKWVHPTAMQLDKGYWIKVDADCVLGG